MRRIAVLTIAVFVVIISLPSPAIQTRHAQQEQDQRPDFRDYPEAPPDCKSFERNTLAPWMWGPPAGPGKCRCYLQVSNCRTGKMDVYQSAPRPCGSVDLDCKDYARDFDRLASTTICCKKEPCTARPTPWFDRSLPCKEPKSPLITISGGTLILTMCGYPVYYNTTIGNDPSTWRHNREAMQDFLEAMGLDQVCCARFNDAVRTGRPCDPRKDVDCDGQPNKSDISTLSRLPKIDGRFSLAPGVNPNSFPTEITSDEIMPQDRCEDCKWEFIKGEIKCNPGSKSQTYEVTWRCPTTSKHVTVRKPHGWYAGCP